MSNLRDLMRWGVTFDTTEQRAWVESKRGAGSVAELKRAVKTAAELKADGRWIVPHLNGDEFSLLTKAAAESPIEGLSEAVVLHAKSVHEEGRYLQSFDFSTEERRDGFVRLVSSSARAHGIQLNASSVGPRGVLIEAEGAPQSIRSFSRELITAYRAARNQKFVAIFIEPFVDDAEAFPRALRAAASEQLSSGSLDLEPFEVGRTRAIGLVVDGVSSKELKGLVEACCAADARVRADEPADLEGPNDR